MKLKTKIKAVVWLMCLAWAMLPYSFLFGGQPLALKVVVIFVMLVVTYMVVEFVAVA